MQAWRPGTTRADLEDEHRKAAGGDAAAEAGELPAEAILTAVVCALSDIADS